MNFYWPLGLLKKSRNPLFFQNRLDLKLLKLSFFKNLKNCRLAIKLGLICVNFKTIFKPDFVVLSNDLVSVKQYDYIFDNFFFTDHLYSEINNKYFLVKKRLVRFYKINKRNKNKSYMFKKFCFLKKIIILKKLNLIKLNNFNFNRSLIENPRYFLVFLKNNSFNFKNDNRNLNLYSFGFFSFLSKNIF